MPPMQSFDVTSGCDMQEVDNAINQTRKEISQRYDFRGVKIEIDFKRDDNKIILNAPDEFKLKAVLEVLEAKMVRRKVPVKNLKPGKLEQATLGTARQEFDLQQGVPTEAARKIVKCIKDLKMKKVQAAIQHDQVRISSPSRDSLQEVMEFLKAEDFGVELEFGNYRG